MTKITFLIFMILFSFALIQTPLLAQTSNGSVIPVKLAEKVAVASSSNIVSPMLGTTSEWGLTVVGLLLGGFLFLFLEVAIIPGFGIAGIIGIAFLVVAIILAFINLSMNMAIAATVAAVLGLILLLMWFMYIFPHTRLGKNFVLQADSSTENGFVAVRDLSEFIGKEGVAASMLRPSGVAKIDGERIDVITDCEYLEKGTKIRVIKAKSGRIIVAPIEESD